MTGGIQRTTGAVAHPGRRINVLTADDNDTIPEGISIVTPGDTLKEAAESDAYIQVRDETIVEVCR